MVLAAAGIPTIVCGKNSLHMVQHLMMLSPDDCYKQKNRQIAYSLLTVIIKGTHYHITVIQFLRYCYRLGLTLRRHLRTQSMNMFFAGNAEIKSLSMRQKFKLSFN